MYFKKASRAIIEDIFKIILKGLPEQKSGIFKDYFNRTFISIIEVILKGLPEQ